MDVIQLKKDMASHIKDCDETLSKMNLTSSVWGISARRNAYRITKKHLGTGSTSKDVVYRVLHPIPKRPPIIDVDYKWAAPLVDRNGPPRAKIWHHAAANNLTPQAIHTYDIQHNGWSGFGYHYYVRKDGKIYKGRPDSKMGAHARGWNDCIGICCEGNFVFDKMPKAQLDSAKALSAWLDYKYRAIPNKKHNEVNATACPGKNFPFLSIIS